MRLRLSLPVVFLLLLATDCAYASYRVHQLRLTHYDAYGRVERTEVVLSTLDQLQYEHYHGGYRWTRVELLDTWYCPGDTSLRSLCQKPRVSERTPAFIPGKRVYLPYNRQPVIP